MAINSTAKYQGYVLTSITQALSDIEGVTVSLKSGKDRSAFIYTCRKNERTLSLGVYIKISTARRSPWRYTFLKQHQEAVELMNGVCDETFIVFVNDDDGVACVDFKGLKELLDDTFEDAEWVSVSRKLNESYTLAGKDGKLSGKSKRSSFPGAISAVASSELD